MEDYEANLTWATKDNVKVQTIDTNGWIVLDTKINVFLDAKAKVASVTEVVLPQLVFPDFESSFENLLCLGSSYCAVHSNLFVTSDTEGTHGVAGLGEDGLLARELFQHLQQ